MRWIVGIVLGMLSTTASAEEPAVHAREVDAAISRGLDFLVQDAAAWKAKHNCVSCHHAALVIWAMQEARQSGSKVDEPALAELTRWVSESGDGRTGVPRPDGIPKALNAKAVWFALGLAADPNPARESRQGQRLMLQTIVRDQGENGQWFSWPNTRPPIFGNSEESMTALATLALSSASAAEDQTVIAARDKGLRWLAETPSDNDPQSLAVRVILGARLRRPAAEWEPLVRLIKERQQADGGWRQADSMPSDAWATGQALYALAQAGLGSDDLSIERGRASLIKSQRANGSWAMTSRPTKPGDDGADSLIPITGAGSAWAVLGLVRSR